MTGRYRLGLVGCGRISGQHFKAVSSCEAIELCAVCDNDAERLEKAVAEYGVRGYRDYDEMLAAEKEMNIVSVCTPSGLHPEMGVKAACRGLHVITEKPMATCLEDADRLIEACRQHRVKLFVIKQNRLNATLVLLKKAVEAGRFGRIFMVNSTVRWNRTQDYYAMSPWRGTRAMDGGAFLNQASHYVDAVQWLVGPVSSVYAVTRTLNHQIEMEDTGIATLEFANGAVGSIEVTMCTYRRNWEGSITIIGEKGTARVGGVAVNRIEWWDFERYADEDRFIMEHNYEPPNIYGYGHAGYYRNVERSLLNEDRIEVDGMEGRKSLEIIMAIYESGRTGRKVGIG